MLQATLRVAGLNSTRMYSAGVFWIFPNFLGGNWGRRSYWWFGATFLDRGPTSLLHIQKNSNVSVPSDNRIGAPGRLMNQPAGIIWPHLAS